MDKEDTVWEEFLSKYNLKSAKLLRQSKEDRFRRVYAVDNCIYKVVALRYETSSNLRVQDLSGEFEILKHCEGIQGVPLPIAYYQKDGFEALVMKRVPGRSLADLDISLLRLCLILIKLCIILFKLSWRGISHNDIKPDNVLLAPGFSVSLIDFDQATRVRFLVAFVKQFVGINIGRSRVHNSLVTVFKECLKKKLSYRTIQSLKRLCSRSDNEVIHILPVLPDDASFQLKTLLKAWQLAQVSNASSPGRPVAYYSLSVEGYHFPGERPWIDRWNMLYSITDYSGKRILELGCNMALLSCFLLKHAHASAALALDADVEIIGAAKLLNLAFGVKPILKQQSFDAPNDWETEISDFKPDIVFALNVLNWVKDKHRLLNFLGRFQEVIYEGHDSFAVESKRLSYVGFRQIDIVGVSERGREVIYCKK